MRKRNSKLQRKERGEKEETINGHVEGEIADVIN